MHTYVLSGDSVQSVCTREREGGLADGTEGCLYLSKDLRHPLWSSCVGLISPTIGNARSNRFVSKVRHFRLIFQDDTYNRIVLTSTVQTRSHGSSKHPVKSHGDLEGLERDRRCTRFPIRSINRQISVRPDPLHFLDLLLCHCRL
jgi:hypothetical protein